MAYSRLPETQTLDKTADDSRIILPHKLADPLALTNPDYVPPPEYAGPDNPQDETLSFSRLDALVEGAKRTGRTARLD